MKRKHNHSDETGGSRKRPKDAAQAQAHTPTTINHPVLCCYFQHVKTLRQYINKRLPNSSKKRLRKYTHASQSRDATDPEVAKLLDSILVGANHDADFGDERMTKLESQSYSQEAPGTMLGSGAQLAPAFQEDIVDRVIFVLFKRNPNLPRPAHLLCHGFSRRSPAVDEVAVAVSRHNIPGLVSVCSNPYVDMLKSGPWARLLVLLGRGGDALVTDLFLECGLFAIEGERCFQICGVPLGDCKVLREERKKVDPLSSLAKAQNTGRTSAKEQQASPTDIRFVRSRMFYAKPALKANGSVRFGMRHMHVLNRFPDKHDRQSTVHIMLYIFPRQFGLHNVFTSKVDYRESAFMSKDYTIRETEIKRALLQRSNKISRDSKGCVKLPKRLRGDPERVIQRLRALHSKCAYHYLIKHYCPIS
ncbi:hypothetical protein BDY21DRAFT_379669, partial [Lineolata rhizophorae]